MKTETHKIIVLVFSIALLGCSTIKNGKIPFVLEHQMLLSKEIEMLLPIPFHIQKDNYEEGVIYYYTFPDSAYIVVLQGSMVDFPMDKYHPNKTKVNNKKKTSVGMENNKFWRKDIYEGVRVYYGNVPKRSKRIYDNVLDETKVW